MRVLRLLLTLPILFFLFQNPIFSQSIYEDAKEVAQAVRSTQTLTIKTEKIRSGFSSNPKSTWSGKFFTLKKNGEKTYHFNNGKGPDYKIQAIGEYEFLKDGFKRRSQRTDTLFFKPMDTIQIAVADSTLQIIGDSLLYSVKIRYSPFQTIISTKSAKFKGDKNFEEKIIYQIDNSFLEIASILNTYTHLKPDPSKYFLFEELTKGYSQNPFFDKKLKNELQLNEDTDNFFQSSISNNYALSPRSYDWEKLMYGDSVLQFEKTISFQDVSINYRKPITSKNELDIANSRINQSSRERGFLDAKTVAVGLSDFIAERAQEELNLTFFQKFKENLDKPSELTVLFPNTKRLMYQFEISNYKTLLSNARESFTVDLDNFGLNFPKVLELPKYRKLYNSPEVYNLALIYSIADLAYREVPVEQILIAGYKKLESRKIELGKSINNKLSNSILFPKVEDSKYSKKKKPTVTFYPKIIKGTELTTLRKYANEYLQALNQCDQELGTKIFQLYELVSKDSDQTTPSFKSTVFKEHYTQYLDQQKGIIQSIEPLIFGVYTFFDDPKGNKLQYLNLEIQEDTILNFYKNTINANLQQKEYLDYFIENPNIEEYNLFFKKAPPSNEEILSRGFSGIRNLIDENFDQRLTQVLEKGETSLEEARTVKGELLRLEKLNEGLLVKIENYVSRADLLNLAIEEEIEFWEKISGKNQSDFDIAALYYLRALGDSDTYVRRFRMVKESAGGDEANLKKLVSGFYFNSLGKNYQNTMEIANQRLDTIQMNFEEKIAGLKKRFKNQKINPKIFDLKKSAFQNYDDASSLKAQLNALEKLERERLTAIEDSLVMALESSPIYQRTQSRILDLQNLNDQIISLAQSENRELTEEEKQREKDNSNEIESLGDQIGQMEKLMEMDAQRLSFDHPFFNNIWENVDSLENLINNSGSKYNNLYRDVPVLARSNNPEKIDSIPTLQMAYHLSDNQAFIEYKKEKIRQQQIDFSQLAEFDTLLVLFDKEVENQKMLKQKKQQLQNYLTALENQYCKNLVEAKVNAENLSKGLEFSTHLLMAFRDYQNVSRPITYSDTTKITVTTNKIDTLKGFILGTSTLDTLEVENKVIREARIDTTIASWISFAQFDSLRNDPLEWNIFLGLLYQRLSSIEEAPDFSAQGTALLATKFFSIANDMEQTRTKLRIKKANDPSTVNFKDYYPFIRSTVDLFNTIITTPSMDTLSLEDKFSSLQNIPQISNQALSLYENIYVKEYGNAILNAMELLRIITKGKLTGKEEKRSSRAVNAVMIYGTFMANMVKAQTSDQVKNILRSATLPPGSSRIKRETTTSFTINSYLGAGIGRDRLLNVPENISLDQDAFGASLSVPIGFTYSFSPNFIKNNSSFSVHVPLLDLGAITAYRQNPKQTNYSIDNLPDFSWNNLFAPGVFVVYNFANSPFSLGVGGQYGPQLREIKFDTGEAINVNSWRFPMAFFTIDVPFFNLHTGSRKIIVD